MGKCIVDHQLALRSIFCVLLACLAAQARAASFDCAAARSNSEKLICGDPTLSALDEALAKAFSDAISVVQHPVALREDEREWIVQERDSATDVQTMRTAYQNRIDVLKGMANDARDVPKEVDAGSLRQTCVPIRHEQDETCKVEETGTVGDGLSYQVQSYQAGDLRTAGGIVVLTGAGNDKLHPVMWDAVDSAHFDAPTFYATPQGSLMELPGSIEGTGDFNAGSLYHQVDGQWREIDARSWLRTLAARLPKGREVWKGVYPDWKKMTADTPLWRPNDGNCCPTAGSASVTLELRGDAIVLTGVKVSDKPLP